MMTSPDAPLTHEEAEAMAKEIHGHSPAIWCPPCERFAVALINVDRRARRSDDYVNNPHTGYSMEAR